MIKHVELINESNLVLRGYLDLPENHSGKIVVFYHGFTGNKSEHAYHFRDYSRILSKNKIASLRLDFSGNGESDGTFDLFTLETLKSDSKLILDYALSIEGIKEVNLLGYSMGGAICTHLATLYSKLFNKLLLWSPAFNISEIIKNRYLNSTNVVGDIHYQGIFALSKQMYESTFEFNALDNLDKINNKTLIIHGEKDLAVSCELSKNNYQKFKNSSFHIIEGAGHGYDKLSEKKELFSLTTSFLENF